jgi:hypothetical protein
MTIGSIERLSIERILTRSIENQIFARSIDFTGHSESAAAAETEPETQTIFLFFFCFFEHKTETKQKLYETKIYLN